MLRDLISLYALGMTGELRHFFMRGFTERMMFYFGTMANFHFLLEKDLED